MSGNNYKPLHIGQMFVSQHNMYHNFTVEKFDDNQVTYSEFHPTNVMRNGQKTISRRAFDEMFASNPEYF